MPQTKKVAAPAEPQDNSIRVKVEGEWYEIDLSDLSWGEAEQVELYFECSAEDVDWETARGTMFVCFLARQRVDATFTLADMKRLKVADFEVDTEPRPTEPAPKTDGVQS